MEKQGRGRPSGAKNKSPFMSVPLSILMEHLATTAKVPVKKSYAIEILGIEDDEIEDDYKEEVVEPLSILRRTADND